MENLKDQVVLVTGASSGFGMLTARKIVNLGGKVILGARREEKLKELSDELGEANVAFAKTDMSVLEEVKNLAKVGMDKFGRIDSLVNNAGVLPRIKQLHEISESEWNEVLDVNLNGPFRFTKYSIPYLQKTSGVIINVSSDAGLKAYEGFNADAYSASKAALIVLTQCWALEYAKNKIRVNCVCPGVVNTDMTKPFVKTEKDREFMDKDHPLGRIGEPDEVAKSILFLA